MKIFLFSLLLISHGFGQMLEGDLLEALEGSGWGEDYQTSSGSVQTDSPRDPQEDGNRTSQDLNCNGKDEQTTIPYKFLLGLLANKSLDPTHDPHSGVLTLNGGLMIGNCQSMLETIISKPSSSLPYYTYQIAVKKPATCQSSTCDYEVTEIENSGNSSSSSKVVKNFKPSFEGFVDCLKETGVFKDGKIEKSKISPVEYVHVERDVTRTSEVVYANRGFKGTRYAGKHSSNKLPNYPGCYYFEDMVPDGFKTYSVDDVADFEMERLYQRVCNSGNYQLINSHISDFDELGNFQTGLIKIRNELILEEVKRLHEIVSEAEDLSEVDEAKFKEVTSDFLEHVIKPLKNDLSQLQRLYANPGHSQKENMLKSVFSPEKAELLLGKDPSELKQIIKEELDKKASELVSYVREPYLTKSDYQKMTSSQANAPLDNQTWTSAVLDLYEAHNTAFNYGRYSDDFWDSHYKDNDAFKNEKRYERGSVLDRKITAKVRDKRIALRRVSQVAANPDVDYGARYERTKQTVLSEIDREIAQYRQTLMQAQIKVQTQCAQEKAQKYWINQQACVREAQEQVEACHRQIRALMASREEAARRYDGMIAEWNQASSQAGRTTSSGSSAPSTGGGQSFTFTPTQPTQPHVGDQYSQQMRHMQQQMMRPQMMGPQRPGLGLNGNFGMNFNAGIGAGPGSMYGMTPPYNPHAGRYPSAMGFGGMPPAMGYYGQQHTMPGGSFNFTPHGGQMWAGGTPGFYGPGGPGHGPPVGGGHGGGGFSFGF